MPSDIAELYKRTQAALNDGSAKNPITVTVTSRNHGGFESHLAIRGFTLISDQPKGFAGGNKGPKPSELLLASLAACQEVTWRLYAEALGVPLDGISVTLRGVQDLRGFLGTSNEVSPGFARIEGEVAIDSPASSEELARLQQTVDAHCPVLDDLRRPVDVSLTLTREKVSEDA